MKRLSIPRCLMLATLSLCVPMSAQAAETKKPPTPTLTAESIGSRLENLERLIHSSSGAQRVEASGKPEAVAARMEAANLQLQARGQFKNGNLAEAARLLDQATAAMFQAVRLAGADEAIAQKRHRDFDNRAASVQELLKALERIAAEKGQTEQLAGTVREVEGKLARAQTLAGQNQLEPGRKALDEAYQAAKEGIEGLRQGDTLVRSLNFANKEEEYLYELDRNDTHRMLISVLVEEKPRSPTQEKKLQEMIREAERLRSQAEAQAGKGDFATAVESLESSTKELVRAIRSSGVYIPG